MKKNHVRNFLLGLLIFISFSSYIYINTAIVPDYESAILPNTQLEEEEAKAEQEVMLPDVKLIKAVIKKGKDLLPAS